MNEINPEHVAAFSRFTERVMASMVASIRRAVEFEERAHGKSVVETVRLWEELYGPRTPPPSGPQLHDTLAGP